MSARESGDLVGGGTLEWAAAYLLAQMVGLRAVREVSVTTPAAGAEFTVTNTSRTYWELLGVHLRLATSAAAGNRNVIVQARDADTNRYASVSSGQNQGAGVTVDYSFLAGLGMVSSALITSVGLPVPPIVVVPGSTVSSRTASLDVGDQYSLIVLTVREWSEWGIYNFLENFGEYLGRVD